MGYSLLHLLDIGSAKKVATLPNRFGFEGSGASLVDAQY